MPVKEFREYFFRHSPVTTGEKPDQETSLVKTYIVKGVTAFMTFLRNDIPSEAMYKKFFESITFKLNKEDTASASIQGLVKKTSDANAETRLANPNTDFSMSVAPHQLPEIVLAADGSDSVVGTPAEVGGLKLSILKRTLGSIFRRNYKLEVNVDKSIEIDGTSKKVQLKNDSTTPGNGYFYGTNSSGTKGWYVSYIAPIVKMYLRNDFSKTNNTLDATCVIGSGGNVLTASLAAGKYYKFEAVLFLNPGSIGGFKVNVGGGATASNIVYDVHYFADATTDVDLKTKITALGFTPGTYAEIDNIGDGLCRITGSIQCNTAGTLSVNFSQKVTNATASIVKTGSYFTVEELQTT